MFKRFLLALLALSFGALSLAQTELSLVIAANPSDPGYASFLEQVALFEAANPGVTLNVEAIDHDNYHTKLQTLAVSGQLPDLIYLWPGKRTSYVTDQGLVLDLRPYIERDGVADKMLPLITAAQGKDGAVYQLGRELTLTNVVYANDAILAEAGLTYPETFDEWLAQASVLEEAGYFPLVMGNKSSWVMQSTMLSPLLGRTAGNDWLDKAKVGDASFADEPFSNALSTIRRMVDADLISRSANSLDRSDAVQLFLNGRAAYFIEGSWSINEFSKSMTDEEKARTSLHALPALSGEVTGNSTSGVSSTGFGINSKLEGTPKADLAWEFIKTYAGVDNPESVAIQIAGGSIPAVIGADLPADTDPLVVKLADLISNTTVTYVLDDQMDAEGIDTVNSALQELILGEANPEQIANDYETWVSENEPSRQ